MALTSIETGMGRLVSSSGSGLTLLDTDEVLATLENLEACRATTERPPSRVVPESLCAELEQYLKLLRAEVQSIRGSK